MCSTEYFWQNMYATSMHNKWWNRDYILLKFRGCEYYTMLLNENISNYFTQTLQFTDFSNSVFSAGCEMYISMTEISKMEIDRIIQSINKYSYIIKHEN